VSRYASFAASALIGAALCAVAFGGGGGFELESLTWVEIGMVAAGGVLVALAALRSRRGRLNGALTLLAFGALALLSALSVLWSVAPDETWLAANLTIGYVALFAGGIAVARLFPDGVAVLLRGILIGAAAVVVYALLTRVFPSLAKDEVFARLGQPYGYWNALGTTAALAVPAALWLGSRRSGHQPVNALAYPLLSLLLVTLFLSYSRGAMIMACVGAALWVALVPLRLRSVTLLGVSLAGAGPVIVWALAQDAFTKNQVAQPVREAIAPEFGLWLLATVLVMLGAGLAIGFRVARRPPPARLRLRAGVAFAVVACSVPFVLFAVLSSSDRGLGGTIKQGYESLTSTSKKTPGGPARLLTASSTRGLYWHQAKEVFLDHYWKGTGADTFGVSRLRYRAPSDQSVSKHAHGYVQQTAADLGTAGLAVSFGLLIAWLVAAGRATGVWRRGGRSLPFGPERIGITALALVAVVFGLHSLVDWVWYVPGPAAMALLAAGFVAGRGPLAGGRASGAVPAPAVAADGGGHGHGAETPELRPEPAPAGAAAATGASAALATLPPPDPGTGGGGGARSTGTSGAGVATGGNGAAPAPGPEDTTVVLPPPPPPPRAPAPPRARRRPPGLARGVRPAAALLTLTVAALCAWAIWQPLRSDRESDHALDLAADNRLDAARAAAERAHDIDPLSPRPFVVRSAVEDAAGQPGAALKALEQAVTTFPGDPQTWLQLAQYQLNSLSKPADALETVAGALYLDPQSRAAQTVFFQASTALNPAPAVPAPAPAPTPAPVPTAPAPPVPGPTPGKPVLPGGGNKGGKPATGGIAPQGK
jgi:hypothetical protein